MANEHTSKQFDAELEAVRSRVLQMGGLVEEQIVQRARSADHRRPRRCADRSSTNDHRVNAHGSRRSTRTAATSSRAASRPPATCA